MSLRDNVDALHYDIDVQTVIQFGGAAIDKEALKRRDMQGISIRDVEGFEEKIANTGQGESNGTGSEASSPIWNRRACLS